ncbi:adenosine receptor A3-like [Actinia tenebrosa]|uniref:Adenosine receptor A3-like n=1 Tax=Actinia tenebrosa TaxID=6105 RepID=A0A6P8I7K8_ACTTE|nr:adenosine receptor A3-like [Actinia tenebrosa]
MLNNSTSVARALRLSVQERVLWSSFFLIESVFIVIGNSIALSIFTKKRSRVNKSTYLLISLTIADLFVGLSTAFAALPLMLYSDGYRNPSYVIVNVYSICTVFSTFSSIVLLTAIAFERAFAIVFPIKHRLAKQRHYFTVIWGSVALSLVISSTVVLLQLVVPREFPVEHLKYTNVFMIVMSLILLVLVLSAYGIIWVKTRFLSNNDERLTTKRNKKIAKTLFIVTVFSFATWLPEGILLGYNTFLCPMCRSSVPKHVCMFADFVLYGNSFVNIFIYTFRMPYFRKELKTLVRRSSRPLFRPGQRSLPMKACTTRSMAAPIMLLSIQAKR